MRGFTLIETVIAIVIIGVVFAGLLAVFTGIFTNACRDEVLAISTSLAKGEMERVTRLTYGSIASTPNVSFGGNFANYSYQIIVSAVPEAIASDVPPMSEYKQIEVRVTNELTGIVSLKTIAINN